MSNYPFGLMPGFADDKSGKECWPAGWSPYVFGQLGIVVNDYGKFVALRLMHVLLNGMTR